MSRISCFAERASRMRPHLFQMQKDCSSFAYGNHLRWRYPLHSFLLEYWIHEGMEGYLIIAIVALVAVVALKNVLFSTVSHVDLETEIDPERDSSKETEQTTVIREFTPRQLSNYNGFDLEKIYMAVKGRVYDVSKGRQFYGPSGPYSNFAGHDASRGLALNSFELEHVRRWDEPIDDLADLTELERKSLDNWEGMFKGKYPCVGTLVPDPDFGGRAESS